MQVHILFQNDFADGDILVGVFSDFMKAHRARKAESERQEISENTFWIDTREVE